MSLTEYCRIITSALIGEDDWRRERAMDLADFERQVNHLLDHGDPITAQDLIAAVRGEAKLPKNGFLMTFDDGYTDHFDHVYPTLERHGIKGIFFLTVGSNRDRQVLDVNRVQRLLDPSLPSEEIASKIDLALERVGADAGPFREKHCVFIRHDPPVKNYIKKMLQFGLPDSIRSRTLDGLIEYYVAGNTMIADDLYMTKDQAQLLAQEGHTIGGHGLTHKRLSHLDSNEQKREIDESVSFIRSLGVDIKDWTFCYPQGDYNETTVKLLKETECALGFVNHQGVFEVNEKTSQLHLPPL